MSPRLHQPIDQDTTSASPCGCDCSYTYAIVMHTCWGYPIHMHIYMHRLLSHLLRSFPFVCSPRRSYPTLVYAPASLLIPAHILPHHIPLPSPALLLCVSAPASSSSSSPSPSSSSYAVCGPPHHHHHIQHRPPHPHRHHHQYLIIVLGGWRVGGTTSSQIMRPITCAQTRPPKTKKDKRDEEK